MDSSPSQCIAITGATGFLGRQVLAALLQRGLSCRALLRAGKALPGHNPLLATVEGDLREPASLAALVEGADAVIHAAAAMGTSDEFLLHQVNVQGSRELAKAAERAGAGRFVYVSSMAARRVTDGPYAASKEAGQGALELFSGSFVTLQPPLIYGPGSQVVDTIGDLSRWRLVPVIGSSAALYPVHVDDVAAVCIEAATREDISSGVFTLPGPDAITFPDFTAAVLRALGSRARVLPLPGSLSKVAARAMEKFMEQPLLTSEVVRAVLQGSESGDLRAAAETLGFAPRGLSAGLATLR
jgi:nucleoside-diphosphate-sugar epimerase